MSLRLKHVEMKEERFRFWSCPIRAAVCRMCEPQEMRDLLQSSACLNVEQSQSCTGHLSERQRLKRCSSLQPFIESPHFNASAIASGTQGLTDAS